MTVYEYLIDWLYPVKCPFCQRLTGRGDVYICPDCIKKLPYVNDNDSVQKLPYIPKCTAPFYYEGALRESFLRYKFGGKNAYARVYADFMRKAIDENEISCDIITWVPLSRKRKAKRGYDQARLLAGYIARAEKLPMAALLKKTKDNPAQSGTGGKAARQANVTGAYRALSPDMIRGKHVLLIDDIVTTGSTLSECAKVLKAAGAASVSAAAFARHRD